MKTKQLPWQSRAKSLLLTFISLAAIIGSVALSELAKDAVRVTKRDIVYSWEAITAQNGAKLTILGKPERQELSTTTNGGLEVPVTSYTSTLPWGWMSYSYTEFPQTSTETEEILNGALGFIENNGASLISRTSIQYQGQPGIDAVARLTEGEKSATIYVRLILQGRYLHLLYAAHDSRQDRSAEVSKFIKSLRLPTSG